jgi:hypothetical protein|tara:strand:+ start:59 stop:193 length:135 start_codon:yes stop_codon:yes gene_type:complete
MDLSVVADAIVNVSWLLFAWFLIGTGFAFLLAFTFFGINEEDER